jgi:DNA-binding CsgD family transcriptional regulator/tetratricopeptide (TPR) repeat protein
MDGAAPTARPAEVFVGRQQELNALAAALSEVSTGEPRFVLIQGEAGIGKSSLIAKFLAGHPNVPVVTASGEESEAFLPYGLVQQLAVSGARISASARGGLDLLSQDPLPANADPLAVGVELLALVSNLQGSDVHDPQGNDVVAVVIEDLQWMDLDSARALLFAFRRLSADRVLVLLTSRGDATPQFGGGWERFFRSDRRVTPLILSGLGTEETGELCRALGHTGLTTRSVQRLREQTGGNPLLTRALLAELADSDLMASDGSLHAPRSLAQVVAHRLAALSPAARDVVAAAAVLGDRCSLAEVAEIAGAADAAAALGEAEQAGFLLEREAASGWQISFVHPLFRQAVYQDLGAARRRELHLRAAAAISGDAALTHRSVAAVGPDAELATDLDEAAGRAVLAGKLSLAARYRQQAAAVTARGPERDERILSAFELLVRSADAVLAEAAQPDVEQLPPSSRRDTALGQLALVTARPLEAETLLRAAWDARDPLAEVAAGPVAAGAEAAFGLGVLLGISGRFSESSIWLNRALATASGSEPWLGTARGMLAVLVTLSGDASKALDLFRDLPERAAMVPLAQTDSITYRGLVKVWSGDLEGAADDLALVVSRMQAGLQLRFPGQPLAFLADAEFRLGRWDDSHGHAELAVSLARDTDRRYDMAFVHSAAARVPACRGDWAVADDHATAAEEAASTFGGFAAIYAASARSILGFARGNPHETLRGAALALAVPEIDCYDDPSAFWWRPLQIWALIRIGELDNAAATLAAFQSRAAERDEQLALINAAWLRGQLAVAQDELDQADQALLQGSDLCGSEPFPFHSGLLQLDHGRCLFRLQRRKAAISTFRSAEEIFTTLGARPFTQSARLELEVLGLRARHGHDADLGGLTIQELRVARAVAAGLSNREVASQLYLSPKTVEFHLSSVFAKLGLSSRHQLAGRISDRAVPVVPGRGETSAQGKTQGNHRSQDDG